MAVIMQLQLQEWYKVFQLWRSELGLTVQNHVDGQAKVNHTCFAAIIYIQI